MFCKILAFFILPCLVISFKMDMKTTFKGESANLINAIQADDKIAVEINGHPIQANRLDNVNSESPGRNQCQDSAQYASNCPGWKWACTDPRYVSFMQNNCKESCGLCSDPGQCQDSNQYASNCPGWTWACSSSTYASFMETNCKKTCGWCTGSGQTCAKIPGWMKNALNVKIIGGQFAPSPIPWQVHLHINFNSLGESVVCGGTILDEETILSAAHCFNYKGATAFPMDGRDFIEAGITSEGSSGQQKILMKTVKIHSQYNSVTADNDISIVKLNTPLTFNNNVKNACLPESSFAPQSNAVVSGWGTTVNDVSSSASSSLKYVVVPLITNAKCVKPHTNYPSNWITSNMVCAGYLTGGKDSCQGDSGGPLVVPKTSSDDTAIVYGVVSWGDECAKAKQPGVYARVTNYLAWIKANMK